MKPNEIKNEIDGLKNLIAKNSKEFAENKELNAQIDKILLASQPKNSLFNLMGSVLFLGIVAAFGGLFFFNKLKNTAEADKKIQELSGECQVLKQKIAAFDLEKGKIAGKYYRIAYNSPEEEMAIFNFLTGVANQNDLALLANLNPVNKFDGLEEKETINSQFAKNKETLIDRDYFLKRFMAAAAEKKLQQKEFGSEKGYILTGGQRIPADPNQTCSGILNMKSLEILENCFIIKLPKCGALTPEIILWDLVSKEEP